MSRCASHKSPCCPLYASAQSGAIVGKKLYVGNLGYGVTDDQLREMFGPYGAVQTAQVITDRDTGRSKGFGFVEMASDQEAQAAITAMHGQQSGGRALRSARHEARRRE